MTARARLTCPLSKSKLECLPVLARAFLSVSAIMPDFYFARYLPLLIHILVAGGHRLRAL